MKWNLFFWRVLERLDVTDLKPWIIHQPSPLGDHVLQDKNYPPFPRELEMKLRTRLTLAFLVCGLLPLCISALVNYYTSTSGMKSIETTGTTAMEAKAKDQLVALRDAKKAQVEQYFNFISNHIQTYAESPSTIEAMKTLNQNYHSFRENN